MLRPAQDARAARRASTSGNYDAAFGGARRDEERSRAKERVFSLRDEKGQWDPKRQRPELWHLLNGRVRPGESIRVFPLSNWTEIDVWQYIHEEQIPVVPMYFAKEREVIVRGVVADSRGTAVRAAPARREAADGDVPHALARAVRRARVPFGPTAATGARRSSRNWSSVRQSERQLRAIDHDQDGSMEIKKREGYF